ncbi:MAG: DUF3604 domain-containing protein [Pseudomonadota bacterium]
MGGRTIIISVLATLAACSADPVTVPEADAAPQTAAATVPANPERNAYFGDLHVHTANSFDAFLLSVRATPDDAYRFAKGEPIRHPGGYDISAPPLDFLAVTDHAEYMGVVKAMGDPASPLAATDIAKGMFSDDPATRRPSILQFALSIVTGKAVASINDQDFIGSVWRQSTETADRHYIPGKFTTFSGYEYTSMPPVDIATARVANLHRNVIFRDRAPDQPFSALQSINPEDLWRWMDDERAAGRDVLAIPHNSNISDGRMFALESYAGDAFDAAYARLRGENEPLVEITQTKGTSETHPSLSPNDEWAGFEQYDSLLVAGAKTDVPGGFVREAYRNGLALADGGVPNPFRFGVIGSSDTHVGAAAMREDEFWGKFGSNDGTPEQRNSVPPDGARTWMPKGEEAAQPVSNDQLGASGLAGVWATENTREAIFDAMRRKETFATSGPRIRVRMFVGHDFPDDLMTRADAVSVADAAGVAMGGAMTASAATPTVVAWAMRDATSVPLERLQVIKVWSVAGEGRERVYDAACAGGRTPDPATNRCPSGAAMPDLETCAPADGGVPSLSARWTDPDYDPAERAAYYVRVLEVPKCRWSTWDAVRNGTPPNPDLPATVQDRAWTSPVWLDPA